MIECWKHDGIFSLRHAHNFTKPKKNHHAIWFIFRPARQLCATWDHWWGQSRSTPCSRNISLTRRDCIMENSSMTSRKYWLVQRSSLDLRNSVFCIHLNIHYVWKNMYFRISYPNLLNSHNRCMWFFENIFLEFVWVKCCGVLVTDIFIYIISH